VGEREGRLNESIYVRVGVGCGESGVDRLIESTYVGGRRVWGVGLYTPKGGLRVLLLMP
jgi:hypothetical protein